MLNRWLMSGCCCAVVLGLSVFSSTATADDPFGGSSEESAASDDPFGGGSDAEPVGGDPFGGGSNPAPSDNADPFGGGSDAKPGGGDPFGGGEKKVDDDGDPFAIGDGEDPFGGGAPKRPKKPARVLPKKDRPAPKVSAGKPVDRAAVIAKINKTLDEKTHLDFIETPLNEAVEYLIDLHGISIVLDERALEEVGIGDDVPITIEMEHASLRSALRHMLRELDLDFVVRDESLVITTPEVVENHQVVRVYDVRDLLSLRDVRVVGPLDPAAEAIADERLTLDYDTLMHLIVALVEPHTWEEVGGPGSVTPFRGMLIFSQTPAIHREVEGLLSALRATRRDAGKATAAIDVTPHGALAAKNVAKIRSALKKESPFDFQETPLDEAVAFLTDFHGITILLDRKGLSEAGIENETPITSTQRKKSLASALRQLLRRHEMTAIIHDETLMITTPEVAENRQIVRVYPVGDLLTKGSEASDLETLADTITTTVDQDTWDVVGGPGAIEVFDTCSCLIVRQTDDVHANVATLLAELREKLKAKEK